MRIRAFSSAKRAGDSCGSAAARLPGPRWRGRLASAYPHRCGGAPTPNSPTRPALLLQLWTNGSPTPDPPACMLWGERPRGAAAAADQPAESWWAGRTAAPGAAPGSGPAVAARRWFCAHVDGTALHPAGVEDAPELERIGAGKLLLNRADHETGVWRFAVPKGSPQVLWPRCLGPLWRSPLSGGGSRSHRPDMPRLAFLVPGSPCWSRRTRRVVVPSVITPDLRRCPSGMPALRCLPPSCRAAASMRPCMDPACFFEATAARSAGGRSRRPIAF